MIATTAATAAATTAAAAVGKTYSYRSVMLCITCDVLSLERDFSLPVTFVSGYQLNVLFVVLPRLTLTHSVHVLKNSK